MSRHLTRGRVLLAMIGSVVTAVIVFVAVAAFTGSDSGKPGDNAATSTPPVTSPPAPKGFTTHADASIGYSLAVPDSWLAFDLANESIADLNAFLRSTDPASDPRTAQLLASAQAAKHDGAALFSAEPGSLVVLWVAKRLDRGVLTDSDVMDAEGRAEESKGATNVRVEEAILGAAPALTLRSTQVDGSGAPIDNVTYFVQDGPDVWVLHISSAPGADPRVTAQIAQSFTVL